jgi:hypothetical protein
MISIDEGGPGEVDELELPKMIDTLLIAETFMVDMADVVAIHGDKVVMSGGSSATLDGMSLYLAMEWMVRRAESREDSARPGAGDEEITNEFI